MFSGITPDSGRITRIAMPRACCALAADTRRLSICVYETLCFYLKLDLNEVVIRQTAAEVLTQGMIQEL